MAVQTSSTQDFTVSGATAYQNFYGGVIDAFITANGWTYVAQTGDGNPNTASPGSTGTFAVFRVYSTTVGSETWYMRLDMGWNGNGPEIKVQFGSGVNGSGTLTGQVGTQQTIAFGGSGQLATNQTYFISAAAGRLSLWMGTAAAGLTNRWFFGVHGGVNGSGVITSGLDWFCDCSSVVGSQNIPVSGAVPSFRTFIPCNNGNSTSEVIGSHTVTFHPFTWNEGGGNNPTPALMIGGTTDFPSTGVIVTAQLYGSTRNFLATGWTSTLSANNRINFLYE